VDLSGPKEAQLHSYSPVGANVHKFSRIRRHLANTIEPSICCGDAALCQNTFSTCLSEPPTYNRKKQGSGCSKLEINLSKVVQQHFVGKVGKSMTFVLSIIAIYSVTSNVELETVSIAEPLQNRQHAQNP